jgi:iduronate 2-sulfatase
MLSSNTDCVQNLSRRNFLRQASGGIAASALAGCSGKSRARRPNVLMLSVDDLNPRIGCYGDPIARSPNIDRVARQGVRFRHGFSQWPACLPSRVSFLSGWYPERTQMYEFKFDSRLGPLQDAVYLPQHLKQQGYYTARLDKVFHIGGDDPLSWNLSEEPVKDEQGNNRVVSTPKEWEVMGLSQYTIQKGEMSRCDGEPGRYTVLDCPDDVLTDGIIARRAVEILEQRAQEDQPFMLACGFRRPHLDWMAPKKYFDMFPPEQMVLPPKPAGHDPMSYPPEDEHRFAIAGYYAAMAYTDTQIGLVLDALEQTGQADNTIIVLFGDQGYMLGERNGHFGKGSLYDLSFRVPLIWSVPWISQRDVVCNRSVQLLDMYPTICELTGLPQPPVDLQGRSLMPLLENPQSEWESRAVSLSAMGETGLCRSIRDDRYRYNETMDGTPLELYDYQNDPNEWRDLVDDAMHQSIREQLQTQLRAVQTA